MARRKYNGVYRGEYLSRVAFPLGGIGAGMVCLEGTGALSHVSVHHRPDVFHEPQAFAGLKVHGTTPARVLEGPVPGWKAYGQPESGRGCGMSTWGLPRFADATCDVRFPFATITLKQPGLPVEVQITGWSPFTPGDEDDSSMPVAALEYRFCNTGRRAIKATFSFHSRNFMQIKSKAQGEVLPVPGGFALHSQLRNPPAPGADPDARPAVNPDPHGAFAFACDHPGAVSDCAWFRGAWFDPLTMLWKKVESGVVEGRPPHEPPHAGVGGSLYVPLQLKPGREQTLVVRMAWYVPTSSVNSGPKPAPATSCCGAGGSCAPEQPQGYMPWYARRFAGLDQVLAYWSSEYPRLRTASATFRDAFYDTSLPPEVVEAVAANLTILKSPTCLRQHDGRFWGWEGCSDDRGCCAGSCTHVWNYAQAMAHLFPRLERSMRETEFEVSQDDRGHQTFRAALPIRDPEHKFHAAADGQLGGVVKVYREWRIAGDTTWLARLWPKVRQSLDYCIGHWDPDHTGTLIEPHHNTYDIEFWGPDGMCTSFYLAALRAAVEMGQALGEDVAQYRDLLAAGVAAMNSRLWNGKYYFQDVQWKGLRAMAESKPADQAEERARFDAEGPKYQYGAGCLSDGVLGDWLARVSGLPAVLDDKRIRKHLDSVFQHNFKADLSAHANPQRPTYCFGDEAGLLLCSWPRGGKPSLPFVYSDEVWTGIEYQVAAHLILMGRVEQGLAIVRALRDRYDGRRRNPFNEYECGHWYARAMASYALLQALGGARYDALTRTLHLHPRVAGDYRVFLATATGYAVVGVRKGKPFIDPRHGEIDVQTIDYQPRRK